MPVALFPHTPLFSPSSTPLLLCDGVSCSTFLASKDEGGGKEIVCVRVGGFDVEVTSMQNTTTTITTTQTATNTARQHGATRTTLDCWLQLLIGEALPTDPIPCRIDLRPIMLFATSP